MERFVAETNIALFTKMLKGETDRDARKVLARLLAEEEAKLRKLPRSDDQRPV